LSGDEREMRISRREQSGQLFHFLPDVASSISSSSLHRRVNERRWPYMQKEGGNFLHEEHEEEENL